MVFNFNTEYSYVESALKQEHEMFLKETVYEGGFEMFNPVYNLGGLFLICNLVFLEAFLVGSAFFAISKIFGKSIMNEGGEPKLSCCQRFVKWINKKQKQIFFNTILLMIKEGSIYMLLSGLLFLHLP